MAVEAGFDLFDPEHYLHQYYGNDPLPQDAVRWPKQLVRAENYQLQRFFAEHFTSRDEGREMLELGIGPGIILPLISASRWVKGFTIAEYNSRNALQTEMYRSNDAKAWDWSLYVRQALILEDTPEITDIDIAQREALIRSKMSPIIRCDITQPNPLSVNRSSNGRSADFESTHQIVSSHFVAESITDSKRQWRRFMRNIASRVSDDGSLLLSALIGAEYYVVGDVMNKAVNITEADVVTLLRELQFSKLYLETIPAEVQDSKAEGFEGYKGMICVRAFRES